MTLPKLAVVMAGGSGTRFWPRSRAALPKQFLPITGPETLLVETVRRLEERFGLEHVFVLTTEDLADEARRQLPELPPENVLLEPEGRNTAPCLALCLVALERRFGNGVMAVLSADHWIGGKEAYLDDLDRAMGHAEASGDLVVFGIPPTSPETGYGYIESEGDGAIRKVTAFREKPPLDVAMAYLNSGRHTWNAGMFVWTLKDFRAALLRHAPGLLAPLDAWNGEALTLASAYAQLPREPIDIALMEKATNVAVVPARFRWSDVGSWPAALAFQSKDPEGNIARGDVLLVDTKDTAVFGGTRLVATAGVEGLIIVDADDALLVTHKDRAQGVKAIVERLRAEGRAELL
ncbi:MAG: sugar phosphate nucleotidyltransferase [Holophagaceae bacterium]